MKKVSILIGVRNEAKHISACLESILEQGYPPAALEIIVLDGMSNDNTREVVKQIFDKYPSRLFHLMENKNKIVSAAFNLGIQKATGDVIMILGGHSKIAHDYVSRCVSALEKTGADCVGGVLETKGTTFEAEGIAIAQSSFFGVGNVAFRTGKAKAGYVDTAVFGAYRKESVQKNGFFDNELVRNQDDEYNYRLVHGGGKIWLDPAIRATYYSRSNLRGLASQYFQYGYWKVRVLQKHPWQMRWRHFVPPAFVSVLIGAALLAVAVPGLAPFFFGLAAIYGAASLAAAIVVSAQKGFKYFGIILASYFVLHMTYGFGFLVGLISFANRWGKQE